MSAGQTVELVPMLVGGHWEVSASDRFGAVFNPSTGREIGRVPLGTAADVDRAVVAAAQRLAGLGRDAGRGAGAGAVSIPRTAGRRGR